MDRMNHYNETQTNETGTQSTGPENNPRPHLDTEINQPGPSIATPTIPQEIPIR